MFCIQCGTPRSSEARYCSECGADFGAASAAQPAAPPFQIPVRCVSGPDAGSVMLVRADRPLLFGRAAGIAAGDPAVGDQHVVLSIQDGAVRFQSIPGRYLDVNGAFVTDGVLRSGQQFRIGAGLWQVGQGAGYEGVLNSLTDRLHQLTATDKLEGFSLREMFSEVFKKRTQEEIEEYFIVGTRRTTPPIREVPTGWPKPWFFMRVLASPWTSSATPI